MEVDDMPRARLLSKVFVAVLMLCSLVFPLRADRTPLKPGFNLFSTQQDIEMGRQTSREAEKELALMHNAQAQAYIEALGRRLVSRAPGAKYPYQFRIVNDK